MTSDKSFASSRSDAPLDSAFPDSDNLDAEDDFEVGRALLSKVGSSGVYSSTWKNKIRLIGSCQRVQPLVKLGSNSTPELFNFDQ